MESLDIVENLETEETSAPVTKSSKFRMYILIGLSALIVALLAVLIVLVATGSFDQFNLFYNSNDASEDILNKTIRRTNSVEVSYDVKSTSSSHLLTTTLATAVFVTSDSTKTLSSDQFNTEPANPNPASEMHHPSMSSTSVQTPASIKSSTHNELPVQDIMEHDYYDYYGGPITMWTKAMDPPSTRNLHPLDTESSGEAERV